MSIHESIYEGTLTWPLGWTLNGIQCEEHRDEDPYSVALCEHLFPASEITSTGALIDALRDHIREAHGQPA